MELKLDLKKSFNNYHWKDKQELKDYIDYMLNVLWEYRKELTESESEKDYSNIEDRLFDILDMFSSYEIIEK